MLLHRLGRVFLRQKTRRELVSERDEELNVSDAQTRRCRRVDFAKSDGASRHFCSKVVQGFDAASKMGLATLRKGQTKGEAVR